MTSSPAALESTFFLNESAVKLDILALGEVMLRLDPGEDRIHTAKQFIPHEGGGEYNVARGLAQVFAQRAGVVTALVQNPVGELVDQLIARAGVDREQRVWVSGDGAGRRVRNGLNFTERGFGPRSALGVSDRGHTAVSQLTPEQLDTEQMFSSGVRMLHTGGIFAALGAQTAEVALTVMRAAQQAGTRVSFDLNYRPSLWLERQDGRMPPEVNKELVASTDILFGNEEDFTAALGYEVQGLDLTQALDPEAYRAMLRRVAEDFPRLRMIATSLREVQSASVNRWGGLLYDTRADHLAYQAPQELMILDRVGGGDSFASGILWGLLQGRCLEDCLALGVSHGALAMSTAGDTSQARLLEVEALARGDAARIVR